MANFDPCCDTVIGGEVYLSIGDRRYEATGDVTIQSTAVSREAGSTSGGRMWVTERSRVVRASFTFANFCDADPIDLFNDGRCHLDVTVVAKSRGLRHLFTKASIVGEPEINEQSGEVSGIEIACSYANYTRAAGTTASAPSPGIAAV